jgi:phenylpropionate dioxygenase-like ring-hydroxylating dioxygenase large terminal subunit
MQAVTEFQAVAGEALEPRLYLDEDLVEVEQRLIFERTWQLIGHVSAVPRPGSYTTGFAGDQSVLVVRDEQGTLKAYRNVCRHRASCLLTRASARARSAAVTTAGLIASTVR